MIKIQKIHIKRYRSINKLELCINTENNFITICGENNAGKTNILRAIDLFFNPEKYERSNDVPNNKQGSGGGTAYPEITVEFLLQNNECYRITRIFHLDSLKETTGEIFKSYDDKKVVPKLTDGAIKSFLDSIYFFFIESINISFPKLINTLIDEIYDIEYSQARFRGLKQELKVSFDNYAQGLLGILKSLSDEINPMFKEYKENWSVDFDFSTDVKNFRDLITNEIMFYISDGSNKNIEGKGSGLQRLAYILMHARIIEKIKSGRPVFLLIDEPDVYLHQRFQKKLQQPLLSLSQKSQFFITTHSPNFIDSYKLENVFLLELLITEKVYVRPRSDKKYHLLETKVVDINQIDGARKIKEYLGIDNSDYELLDKFNLIVEGGLDKFYLTEIARFFDLELPNIISAGGADNIPQHLDFYESCYKGNGEFEPHILVLLDNDVKGREVSKRIKPSKYSSIKVIIRFIPNFLGEAPSVGNLSKVTADHQIEDFIYPRLLCELVNLLLKKQELKTINSNDICTKIQKPAFKNRGILDLIDTAKNEKNPDDGQKINFVRSDQASNSIKQGLSQMLKIQGDKTFAKILQEESIQYPEVENFLRLIADPKNFVIQED